MLPELSAAGALPDKLSLIERRDLDGADLQFPEHLQFIGNFAFDRIRGRQKLLKQNENQSAPDDIAAPLLTGLYALQTSFCYVIDSHPDHVEIHVGSRCGNDQGNNAVHRCILEGYVGSENLRRDSRINDYIRKLASRSVCGAITGVPAMPPALPAIRKIIPSDKWLKALQGEKWTYLFCGFCLSREMIAEYERQLIAEVAILRNRSIRDDILYEEKRLAEHYQSALEAYLKRLEQGRLIGAWQTGIYFFAESEAIIRQGLGMISSHFSNRKTIVQPIRAHLCRKNKELKPSFANLLTSSEAAALLTLPEEEVPGFEIRQVAQFDTDLGETRPPNPVEIGKVIRNWMVTENTYSLEMADLSKHGLVTGVTGSGKTTTCLNILRQLKQKGVPFLVIESAKSEYRQLLNDPLFGDMLIFTLGDETPELSAPFRMNPFEVPAGILVQTHLDYLKSLFRASFVMYAPMPYVLEEALYEVYRDKGWNLSANANERGMSNLAFPTLTDLYEKIDGVVSRLGYDERISKDILAGLKTRINNMRLGGKGLMLDTRQSVSIDRLMEKPVLLELKKLGNDDEKAFIIGLILTRIYEYYDSRERKRPPMGISHLTLIEEAHRLLKHVPEEASEADGNVRGKAVETFCNMLAEIRAYGEAVFVAEQIPAKLARDVIKNTNLKIMHRIVARDDRDIVGDTMNLTEEQKRYVTTLEKGKALIYAEGMDSPFLVSVPAFNIKDDVMVKPINEQMISRHMHQLFYAKEPFSLLRYPECKACGAGQSRCETLRETIKGIIATDRAKEHFNRVFLTVALSDMPPDIENDIDRLILGKMNPKDQEGLRNARLCFIVHAMYQTAEAQGSFYEYPYSEMERLVSAFVLYMKSLMANMTIEKGAQATFRETFDALRKKTEVPFPGCFHCGNKCYYRFETARLLRDGNSNADYDYVTTNVGDDNRMWTELARLCKKVSHRTIRSNDPNILKDLALCYLSQKVAHVGHPPALQEKVIRNINRVFEQGAVRLEDQP